MSIFATKSIERIKEEQIGHGEGTLQRVLGPGQLIMLGVGAIIGTGIFVLTGQAAAANAGPAIVLSMIIAGVTAVLAALCYSEFAATVPVAGSAYTYAYATLGEFVAWVIGWDLILEYALGSATVAVGWSGNLITLLHQLGWSFPAAVSAAPGTVVQLAGGGTATAVFNLPAVLITVAVTLLLIRGVSESATVNAIVVVIKVGIVLVVIGAGAFFIVPANWHPFIPPNTGTFGAYGWSGVLRGAGVIFFAYIGFDAVSTSGEETRNPGRDLPIAIVGSLIIATTLYIAVAVVAVGALPFDKLKGAEAPLATALDEGAGFGWASNIISFGALVAITSVVLTILYGQTRIFFAMCRDGLMPRRWAYVHPKTRTPIYITAAFGSLIAIIAAFVPLSEIVKLVNIGTLFAFLLVNIGVIILRRTRPDLKRGFRVPFVPVFPIIGSLLCIYLMRYLDRDTWIRFVVWLAIGLVVYFLYGRRHSRLRQGEVINPEAQLDKG